MLSGFRRNKLVTVRDGFLAARVGVRRGSALPPQAAIRHVVSRSAGRKAFKGPEKQNRHHQANGDVKSTSHFSQGSTRRTQRKPDLPVPPAEQAIEFGCSLRGSAAGENRPRGGCRYQRSTATAGEVSMSSMSNSVCDGKCPSLRRERAPVVARFTLGSSARLNATSDSILYDRNRLRAHPEHPTPTAPSRSSTALTKQLGAEAGDAKAAHTRHRHRSHRAEADGQLTASER